MTGLDNERKLCEWGSPGLGAGFTHVGAWAWRGAGRETPVGWLDIPDLADWKVRELSAIRKAEGIASLLIFGAGRRRATFAGEGVTLRRGSLGLGPWEYRLADLET